MVIIKKLIVFTLMLSASFNFAQLTGTAFLGSQSNHSGIKVKFKANPGTAVTDSTLTDAAGNYSINITPGSYNISFSKAGFQGANYANNTAQLLTNTVTLGSVTLTPGNYVYLTGNVTGTLVNTNIYIFDVSNPVNVPLGSTLTIQPGTVIKVAAYHPFNVYGTLIAEGTPNNKILFTSNQPTPTTNDWVGIEIYNSNTRITNCIVEYAHHCLFAHGCSPLIEYNDIRKFWNNGIVIDNSPGVVRHNKVYDFGGNSWGNGIAGGSQYTSPPTIECNEVYNGGAGYVGIYTYYKAIVKNNYTHHMFSCGITSNWADSSLVVNNVSAHNAIGITVMGYGSIVNNTVYDNSYYGILMQDGPGRRIVNNLVVNNTEGITASFSNATITPTEITHNCVWNNNTQYSNTNYVGIGQTIGTNSYGDPIDAYYNFSVDPNFAGGIPPYLNSNSHTYGVGNPQYSVNIGCNTSLICSNIVLGVNSIQNNIGFSVYPNPFSSNITLKGLTEKVSVSLIDILGKDVKVNVTILSKDEQKVETENLNKGIYFLTITSGNASKTVKLIKN